VLLLHGIGNYGRAWDLVAEAVAGRLRLVAPDARGHGGRGDHCLRLRGRLKHPDPVDAGATMS